MTTLMRTSIDPVEYCEREISATFENGGEIEITVRGDSIGSVLEILLAIVGSIKLNRERSTDLKLRYWHLTDEIESTTVESMTISVEEYNETDQRLVRRLAADAKASLIQNLARHHITLRGERGELA